MTDPSIILASGSPRRAELLRMLRIPFEVAEPDVDERPATGESPQAQAERLARDKADVVGRRFPGRWVLAGDTIVVLAGDVLGKPGSREEAVTMLLRLQGRSHRVASGVAVHGPTGHLRSGVEETTVTFRPFTREEAEAYVATGEPMDKAGAYGIQGLGAALVERVEGDFFGVMGFPLILLLRLLREEGLDYRFGAWSQGSERASRVQDGQEATTGREEE